MAAALLSMSSAPPTGGGAPQVPGMTITTGASTPPMDWPISISGRRRQRRLRCLSHRPDGSPTGSGHRTKTLFYALAFDSQGRLLAGTGNRGHIFAVSGLDDFSDLLKAAASQVTAFAKARAASLRGDQQSGQGVRAGTRAGSTATYESDVFDARIFSRWGRAEFRA